MGGICEVRWSRFLITSVQRHRPIELDTGIGCVQLEGQQVSTVMIYFNITFKRKCMRLFIFHRLFNIQSAISIESIETSLHKRLFQTTNLLFIHS